MKNSPDYSDEMKKLANTKMPFGKYNGQYLVDLPEEYIIWLRVKGLPQGELGMLIEQIYEIKLNGLENIIRKFRTY